MYEKDGKYYTESELCSILSNLQGSEVSLFQDKTPISDMSKYSKEVQDEFKLYTLKESGELVDFITNELSFSLSNPVEILPQYSYDGSVNLILNDGLNIPRLINSRFTVTGKNTYKIIDRKGDNDTNIYDQGSQFDVDTSLFKNVNKIPKLEYLGTSNGNMKIGNYHFYFKYSDVDGNESDWVAESGLVSVFMGNTPQSVNTGIRDENSIKSVRFKLSNIDMGYSYVKVYYTRYTADVDSNLVVQAKRIDKNFLITSAGISHILITGDENETEVTLEEINSSFDVIQTAQTQCTASNRLFMANIHKTKVEVDGHVETAYVCSKCMKGSKKDK
jgi:ribosomal protein L28